MRSKSVMIALAPLLALTFFSGCVNPTFSDMVGTWMAHDSCTITLKADSTCIIKHIDMNKITTLKPIDALYSFKGKWEFNEYYLSDRQYNITIHADSIPFHYMFFIRGHDLLGIRPPWYFYQFIGDPDEMNMYKFIKQE